MTATIEHLAAALVKAQADFPTVLKESNNPFFKSKYADLATVVRTATPVLAKHGLAVSQFVSNLDGASALTTILIHESGQCIEATMPLLLPKQDPQGQGSAITYARRYAYMSVLGLVADEDDDGNRAASSIKAEPTVPIDDRKTVQTVTADQVQQLFQLAKGKGYGTKAAATEFLNALALGDITDLPASEFQAVRQTILETKAGDSQEVSS